MTDDAQPGAELVDPTEPVERTQVVGRTLRTSVSNPKRIRI